MTLITSPSRESVKVHLRASFERIRAWLDEVGGDPERSVGSELVVLQEHLIGELRWLKAVAPGVDARPLVRLDGQRQFLKRYSNELIYLARALKAAVEAGPVSSGYSADAHAAGWRRVRTGLIRVVRLEDEARQL